MLSRNAHLLQFEPLRKLRLLPRVVRVVCRRSCATRDRRRSGGRLVVQNGGINAFCLHLQHQMFSRNAHLLKLKPLRVFGLLPRVVRVLHRSRASSSTSASRSSDTARRRVLQRVGLDALHELRLHGERHSGPAHHLLVVALLAAQRQHVLHARAALQQREVLGVDGVVARELHLHHVTHLAQNVADQSRRVLGRAGGESCHSLQVQQLVLQLANALPHGILRGVLVVDGVELLVQQLLAPDQVQNVLVAQKLHVLLLACRHHAVGRRHDQAPHAAAHQAVIRHGQQRAQQRAEVLPVGALLRLLLDHHYASRQRNTRTDHAHHVAGVHAAERGGLAVVAVADVEHVVEVGDLLLRPGEARDELGLHGVVVQREKVGEDLE